MKQVAVGIIMSDGHVLACQRRRDSPYPLKWEFPGGKLEDGELPEAAVVRELREELGIDVVLDRELCRQDWIYPVSSSKDGNDAYRVFYYIIHRFEGSLQNRAFERIQWVTPVELMGMDILDGNRKAVEILVSNEKKNNRTNP